MPCKRIHINQHVIRSNRKTGENSPVVSVKVGNANHYGFEVDVLGPCKIVYRPDKPLACGARVWCETESAVLVDGREIS